MTQATHCDYVDPDSDEECALVDTQLVQVYWIEAEHRPSAVAGWAGELKMRHLCAAHLAQGEAEGWLPTERP
jgi:hypothetical protein